MARAVGKLARPAFIEYDVSERLALARHVLWALDGDKLVPKFDPQSDALFALVEDSLLLPRFLHKCVDEEALDLRALNRPKGDVDAPLPRVLQLQNHTLFVNAAAAAGSVVPGLQPSQLLDVRSDEARAQQRPQLVLQQLYTLVHTELLGRLTVELMPELLALGTPEARTTALTWTSVDDP